MGRLVVFVALVAVAVIVAVVLQRRRPEPPTQSRRWPIPTQLDRADFEAASVPWLVAVFTSSTCDSCQGAVERAEPLRSRDVAVAEVSYQRQRDLHERYHVEAVPVTVVADALGVVRAGWVGTVTATDLWAAVAEARTRG